jgi:dipeptide/tripeptide permease
MVTIWLGAVLVIVGIVYLASQTIWRGRLSDARPATPGPLRTLEPDRRGLRFLGLQQNWPGLAIMAIGLVLLFWGAVL